jgi:hypothetical protein
MTDPRGVAIGSLMNGWRRAAVAAMSCASLACGGKLADDATTTTDAAANSTGDVGLGWSETGPPVTEAAPPPPPSSCSYTTTEITNDSNGVCSSTETWTCGGGDLYELQCNCWSQTCECLKNDQKMLAFGFQGNCPSCDLGATVIAKCPFPH